MVRILEKFLTSWYFLVLFLKVPGVGYYYAGVVDKKSQLTTLFSSFLAIAVVSFQVIFLFDSFCFKFVMSFLNKI